jgi:O-antigen/teichoic acid export membrane protein
MIYRAVALWLLLMVVAIANGVLREKLLMGWFDPGTAQVVSTAMLAVLVLLLTVLTVGWLRARGRLGYLAVGVIWVALSVAFEFLFGHYVLGESWQALLAAYRIDQGSPWPVFLLVVLVAPYLAATLRGRT